jgi:hypothetical protein
MSFSKVYARLHNDSYWLLNKSSNAFSSTIQALAISFSSCTYNRICASLTNAFLYEDNLESIYPYAAEEIISGKKKAAP